jgi:hypothetical protein
MMFRVNSQTAQMASIPSVDEPSWRIAWHRVSEQFPRNRSPWIETAMDYASFGGVETVSFGHPVNGELKDMSVAVWDIGIAFTAGN